MHVLFTHRTRLLALSTPMSNQNARYAYMCCVCTHIYCQIWQLGIYASRPARGSGARCGGSEALCGGGAVEQIEVLSASEYVFSDERMKRNCNRLRIGAIRSRKKQD